MTEPTLIHSKTNAVASLRTHYAFARINGLQATVARLPTKGRKARFIAYVAGAIYTIDTKIHTCARDARIAAQYIADQIQLEISHES